MWWKNIPLKFKKMNKIKLNFIILTKVKQNNSIKKNKLLQILKIKVNLNYKNS